MVVCEVSSVSEIILSGFCVQPLWRHLVSHSGRHNHSSKPKITPSKGEMQANVCVCVCVCGRQEREEEERGGSHLLMLQSCGPSRKPWKSCVAEPSPWWFTGGEWEQERHWIETWNISGALLGPVAYLSKGTNCKLACLFDKFKHNFLDINYFLLNLHKNPYFYEASAILATHSGWY